MSHFYIGEHFRNNQNSWNFMNKGMMIGYSPFLGNGRVFGLSEVEEK